MKTTLSKERLLEGLAQEKKITAEQLKEITESARKEKKSIFHLLVQKELMKEDEMVDFLSDRLDIPVLNLPALRIPKETLTLVPKKIVERYQVLPISLIGNLLTMAVSDPFELMLRDDLKELTKCELCYVLVSPKMIATALDSYYAESSNLEEILVGIDEDSLEVIKTKDKDEGGGNAELSKAEAQDAPVIRMVNLILDGGIKQRASDIHFEPYEKDFRVRYRIDGALRESFSHARELYNSLVARIKIVSQMNITEKRLPQDGRFRAKIQNREIDFRVSILPTYHGEKVVIRVLDKSGVKSGLDKLGFTEKPTACFAEAIKRPYGMILVTGPTGSGKSTTLYTILNTLNTPDKNIMTIEDPVEYQVEGITQTQANSEVGLTFAVGLRSLLRQSPDIVLVGEIRDSETGDIGIKAALTGHLVFSTLHTNSASGAITRLTDMGVEPFLISASLICAGAQRLMRKSCQYCKAPYEVPEEVLRRCHLKASDIKEITPYKGKGCAKCNNSGYFGRMGAIEVLMIDPDIRELIIQKNPAT